jgi:hypothetical protein
MRYLIISLCFATACFAGSIDQRSQQFLTTPISVTNGGTGLTGAQLGDILYGSAPNTYSILVGNTAASRTFLRQEGTGTVSAAPAWDTVTKTDVGLSNVENTALSTWVGTANITTVGNVTSGTWNGTEISAIKGGTGQTVYATGDILYASSTTALSKLNNGTGWLHNDGAGVLVYSTPSKSDIGLGNVENTALSSWAGSANISTVGNITSGTWNGTEISATKGGTGQTVYATGDILYASSTTALSKLNNGTGWLHNDGAGVLVYSTPSKSDVGLGNVENTALSSWAGSANISTVGNVTSGTWNGTEISAIKGGTGQTGYAIGDLLYASSTTALGKLANGTTGQFLMANSGAAETWASPGTPSALGTAAAAGAAGGFAGAAHVHAAPTVTGPGLAATSTTGLILTTTTGNINMTASSGSGNTTIHLAYVPTDGMVNRVINGEMRIDQRYAGTPVSIAAASTTYSLDRWNGYGQADGSSFTISQSTTSPPDGFAYYLHATTMIADASIGNDQMYMIRQPIEANNVSDLAEGTASASTITLGFYARSNTTGQFGGAILSTSTGSYPFKYTINAANTWELQSITIPGDTAGVGTWTRTGTSTGATISFDMGCGSDFTGTANAWVAAANHGADSDVQLIGIRAATFDITGVQLVKGTVAPQYLPRAYAEELRLCQRYFQKSYEIGTAPGTAGAAGTYIVNGMDTVANSVGYGTIFLPVQMRTTCVPLVYGIEGGLNKISNASSADQAANTGKTYSATSLSFLVVNNSGGDATTSAGAWKLQWVASCEL